jgi:hypothetical protein
MSSKTEDLPYTAEQLRDVRSFARLDKDNFYALLDVSKDASDVDIKKAYKRVRLNGRIGSPAR